MDQDTPETAVERDLFGKAPPKGKRSWSHRRAEPRPLALTWTCFLLGATLLLFFGAGALGAVTPENYRPAARTLMLLVFVGVTLLWPMLRLSQLAPPDSKPVAALKDIVVLIVPAGSLALPQMLLADWPPATIGVLMVSLLGWALLTGAILSYAQNSITGAPSRAAWTLVFVVMGAAAPMIASLVPQHEDDASRVRWSALLSPWTTPHEITRQRAWTGAMTRPLAGHRSASWALLGLGAAAWGLALVVEPRRQNA